MDNVTSFVRLDDVSDERIDRLTRDLEGVKHLTTTKGSHVEHVFEAEGVVLETNEDEDVDGHVHTSPSNFHTRTPTTYLPRHTQSEVVDLIKGLYSKYGIFNTMCEKVEKMEERLQRIEEKLDMILGMVEAKPKKRESRKSKHVKSLFNEIRYNKKRKTRKDKEEVGEADKEKADGSN